MEDDLLEFGTILYEDRGKYCVIGAMCKAFKIPLPPEGAKEYIHKYKSTVTALLFTIYGTSHGELIQLQQLNDNQKWIPVNLFLVKHNLKEKVRPYALNK